MPIIDGKFVDGHDFLEPISKEDLEMIERLEEKVFILEEKLFQLNFLDLNECLLYWWKAGQYVKDNL